MKRMKSAQSRKSRSWWWDSHISPENSKWLSENVQEMEAHIKEMLGFFEEENEYSAEKADVYYQERPILVSRVKNFYHMYRTLAERYDNVTGELRKSIPSSLQPHSSCGNSVSDSETQSPASTELDMQDKMDQEKSNNRPDCFDVSIGSGVSSDVFKKGSDGSLSSSESDSEADEAKEENGNSIFYAMSEKVIELEDELHEARGKLDALEEKNMLCQCNFGTNLEVSDQDKKLQVSDVEPKNDLGNEFEAVNSEKDALEAKLLANKNEIVGLNEAIASAAKHFETELAHRYLEVDKCKKELRVLSEKYLYDKSALESEIGILQGVIMNFEGEIATMSNEKLQLKSQIEELEQKACSLDYSASEIARLQEVIKNTQAELENVSLEKEESIKNLEAQLERASQEKSTLQNQIKEMEQAVCDSLEKHSLEKSYLSAELVKLSEVNASLEGKLTSMEAELKQAYADKAEESLDSEKQISVLNQDLADLTSKLELISSEKAMLDNKLAALLTDITTRDEKIKQTDEHLNQLQLEHASIVAETSKSLTELRALVSELKEEVEMQKLVISESAEGKREAIRQLCFSLEHYRSGYQQLREMLQQGQKRPLVMAA